jgi:hypothetical protein
MRSSIDPSVLHTTANPKFAILEVSVDMSSTPSTLVQPFRSFTCPLHPGLSSSYPSSLIISEESGPYSTYEKYCNFASLFFACRRVAQDFMRTSHLFSQPSHTSWVLLRALFRICMGSFLFRWTWFSMSQYSYLYTRIWESLPRIGRDPSLKGDPQNNVKWIDVCPSLCARGASLFTNTGSSWHRLRPGHPYPPFSRMGPSALCSPRY